MKKSLWELVGGPRARACRSSAIAIALALLIGVLLGGFQVPQVAAVHAQTTISKQQNGATIRTQAQDGMAHLDVFVRGADNALWHRSTNLATGIASPWHSLGGHIDSAPSVVSWGPGRIDVFARDFLSTNKTNGFLDHVWFDNGKWSQWETLAPPTSTSWLIIETVHPLTSAPTVASWGPGRLDVFAFVGHALVHKWFNNGWHDWETLSNGNFVGDPAAISWGQGRIDVFVRSSYANALEDKVFDHGRWTNWQDLGGILTSSPAVTSAVPGQLHVFVRNTANGLSERTFWAGRWGGWENIDSNTINSSPAAAIVKGGDGVGDGRLSVFALGFNRMLWENFKKAGYWAHWNPLQPPPAGLSTSAPAALFVIY
ncbi:hypothetical protein KSF_061000 [Reticulibacter mediterranei]|uniref:PLL-like beta propeller domain-containing protein n=1 Tax=Reticulibacter mediterranei TaxID=2778369 RepID=A0A8J3N2Q3_9CHLR|nr:hypothetical protein [Reticulibacter mediterranei]GHO96052.1 hypothetical protein KSF_061000 [Reticulibacter mediterranei]